MITIVITFWINENKVSFLFVNLIYVSKPRNPLETWWNMFEIHAITCLKTIELCSNMVMFILVSILYKNGVWQLEEWLSSCVHKCILNYFFVVWACKISLKSMLRSYVSKFKLSIFHFRCNSLYNLNIFQYQIVLCFGVHFIMGSLKFFQTFYLSILSCLIMLCYHARF